MLKVSWKILTSEEKAAKSFHMVDALVLMPPPDKPKVERPSCLKPLGCSYFHGETEDRRPKQWDLDSSLEHIKNVPDKDEVAADKLDGPYNFFSISCKDLCPPQNATPPRPWDPDPALELKFRKDDSFKSQIVR